MKKKIKNLIKYRLKLFLVVLVFSLSVTPLFAQDDFDDPDEADIPMDGGLSILIAASVGYGLNKMRSSKKGNDPNRKHEN